MEELGDTRSQERGVWCGDGRMKSGRRKRRIGWRGVGNHSTYICVLALLTACKFAFLFFFFSFFHEL